MNILIVISYAVQCAFILLLAGKDASSYLLKDKKATGELVSRRIDRWHRDGVALWLLFVFVGAYNTDLYWQIPVQALLIRLAFYDVSFNKWSSLAVTFLGSTAWADQLFVKIFGINGAIKKAITFLIISVAFTLWQYIKQST